MKKNILSEEQRKDLNMAQKKIPLFFLLLFYGMGILFFYLEYIKSSFQSFKNYAYSNPDLIALTVFFPMLVGGGIAFLSWWSNIITPKYINWNEKGIYYVNQRDKKKFLPWGRVKEIKPVSEYGGKNEKYPEYNLLVRGRARKGALLSGDIGEGLEEYFNSIKDDVEPIEVPYHERKSFKITVYIIIMIILSILFAIYVFTHPP